MARDSNLGQGLEELGYGVFKQPELLPSVRSKARGMGCLPGVAEDTGHRVWAFCICAQMGSRERRLMGRAAVYRPPDRSTHRVGCFTHTQPLLNTVHRAQGMTASPQPLKGLHTQRKDLL